MALPRWRTTVFSRPRAGGARRVAVCLSVACALVASRVSAADPPALEEAAAKLLRATVTVRISPATPAAVPGERNSRAGDETSRKAARAAPRNAPAAREQAPSQAAQQQAAPQQAEQQDAQQQPAQQRLAVATAQPEVTVCSGTSLGEGLIVTCGRPSEGPATRSQSFNYRVTLPDGEQSAAAPAVIDAYSGLVLLKIDNRDVDGLALAPELPKIGGTVLTAAASGIEPPLVSAGVLSGVERTIGGFDLPPMILCDISTTDASAGAAIIDEKQRLVGVIAATGAANEKFGWTYAVPVSHVRRMLAAQSDDRLVVLVRQRPQAGLRLGPGGAEETVRVEHVVPGGPADKAGVRTGDLVQEVDGRKIRNAYQAVALIMKRQPGDRLALAVSRQGERQEVELTLSGAAAVTATRGDVGAGNVANQAQQVQVGPQLNVKLKSPYTLEVRDRQGVNELPVAGNSAPRRDNQAAQADTAGGEIEQLRVRLQTYQASLAALEEELKRQQSLKDKTESELDTLRKEMKELKKKVLPAL